jgi:nucleotide-binding universal stress UspA family protein
VLVAKRRVVAMQRVLAATDGSLHAESALRFLTRLDLPDATEVRVCAVSEAPGAAALGFLSPVVRRLRSLEFLGEAEKRTANNAITRARQMLNSLKCRQETSLRIGEPQRELMDEVRRWIPDLLVVGARGRTTGPEAHLGSVALDLLRLAPCPTLVVR